MADQTVTVKVVADPDAVEAIQELVGDLATAFRRLSTAVDEAVSTYRLALEHLELERADT